MLEEIVPLSPSHFFATAADCPRVKEKGPLSKHYRLPDLSSLHGQRPFAEVRLGWQPRGITATILYHRPLGEVFFPDFQSGDAVELFFDTRDVKTSGFCTRFCHHFYFLPKPLSQDDEEVQAGEITRFRTDDSHELCDASLLSVETTPQKKGYTLHIFIPTSCLHGYDPTQFKRLGFTYRLHRTSDRPQYFSASSDDFSIEKLPSLWASLNLTP